MDYLTPKDVAGRLDVSYVTVMNYINRGQLRALKIGGRWYIKPEDFEEFLESGNFEEEE